MNWNFKLVVAFVLSALCVATAFAYTGKRHREQQPMRQRPAPVMRDARELPGGRGQVMRQMPAEPRTMPQQTSPQRRFALPPGGGYERNGKVYPPPFSGMQSAPVMRRQGRLSPEQRSTLRRQINEVNRAMPYPPR